MKAYTDHGNHFFLSPREGILITRDPRIKFADRWPKDLKQLPDEQVPRVVEGFLNCAAKYGGFSLAIYYLKENLMSSKGNFLVLLAGVIAGNYDFQKDADAAVKEGGRLAGGQIVDEAGWNGMSIEERCKLARPLLNEKEAAKTADGEGFAKSSWKVASRFKNPKPAANEKTAGEGKPAKEVKPRAKGVKTLIYELFTRPEADGQPAGNELHLSVEEIMAAVNGTKASVTTAISDLRSVKYAGKQGTLNLVRADDKYAVENGPALEEAKKRQAAADKAEAEKKEAVKKAKADAKAAEAAAATAKTTETAAATA